MSAERIERPAVYPGQWLDCVVKANTLVGCHTCGWDDEGPYEEVRARWLAHTHDPVFDIEARLKGEPQLMPATDVIWLLAQLEPTEDLVDAVGDALRTPGVDEVAIAALRRAFETWKAAR